VVLEVDMVLRHDANSSEYSIGTLLTHIIDPRLLTVLSLLALRHCTWDIKICSTPRLLGIVD